MPDKPAEHVDDDEFTHQYGATFSSWAMVEHALALWFYRLIGVSIKMGFELFYSGRGFRARADLFKAAVSQTTAFDEETVKFLRAAIKKAEKYSNARNQLAHRMIAVDDGVAHLVEGTDWERNDARTLKELVAAHLRFMDLHIILLESLADHPKPRSESLAQIEALPKEVFSRLPSQEP